MIQPKSHKIDDDVQLEGIPANLTENPASRSRPSQIGSQQGHYRQISGIEYPTAMPTEGEANRPSIFGSLFGPKDTKLYAGKTYKGLKKMTDVEVHHKEAMLRILKDIFRFQSSVNDLLHTTTFKDSQEQISIRLQKHKKMTSDQSKAWVQWRMSVPAELETNIYKREYQIWILKNSEMSNDVKSF
jgi:hypothetical protein